MKLKGGSVTLNIFVGPACTSCLVLKIQNNIFQDPFLFTDIHPNMASEASRVTKNLTPILSS